jgi:uroporphyrinogen-III synthase
MKQDLVPLLSTRPLPGHLIEDALLKGVAIDVISFIETTPVLSLEIQQEIELSLLQRIPVIFTSMNAVDAVVNEAHGMKPDWQIYCIGNTTREKVAAYFGEACIRGTAANATELAELMVAHEDPQEVYFFCGNLRRNELPGILSANDFQVTEIVVYQTVEASHPIEKNYAGILFFSPSAVKSFFSTNNVGPHTLMFAIGDTTAHEIKLFSNNKIIVADEPGKENLVTQAVACFYSGRF